MFCLSEDVIVVLSVCALFNQSVRCSVSLCVVGNHIFVCPDDGLKSNVPHFKQTPCYCGIIYYIRT